MTSFSAQTSNAQDPAARRKLILSVSGVVVSLGILLFFLLRATLFAPADANDVSRTRILIDSETNEVVQNVAVEDGTLYPWNNPKTGKATLYPPETCYWTKDGKAKTEPTYVLLNSLVGKSGKTLCPDCGREVVAHNPKPPTNLMVEAYQARAAKSPR